jgi:hypothetical protein
VDIKDLLGNVPSTALRCRSKPKAREAALNPRAVVRIVTYRPRARWLVPPWRGRRRAERATSRPSQQTLGRSVGRSPKGHDGIAVSGSRRCSRSPPPPDRNTWYCGKDVRGHVCAGEASVLQYCVMLVPRDRTDGILPRMPRSTILQCQTRGH